MMNEQIYSVLKYIDLFNATILVKYVHVILIDNTELSICYLLFFPNNT